MASQAQESEVCPYPPYFISTQLRSRWVTLPTWSSSSQENCSRNRRTFLLWASTLAKSSRDTNSHAPKHSQNLRVSPSLFWFTFSYVVSQIYQRPAYRPLSRRNPSSQPSNPLLHQSSTATRIHFHHWSQKPHSQSCPKIRRISTSTTFALSRSWAAASRAAKSYKAWYLVANRKVFLPKSLIQHSLTSHPKVSSKKLQARKWPSSHAPSTSPKPKPKAPSSSKTQMKCSISRAARNNNLKGCVFLRPIAFY